MIQIKRNIDILVINDIWFDYITTINKYNYYDILNNLKDLLKSYQKGDIVYIFDDGVINHNEFVNMMFGCVYKKLFN